MFCRLRQSKYVSHSVLSILFFLSPVADAFLLVYFLMRSPKIIYLKTAPPPNLTFYFLMLSLKIIYLKTAPPPPRNSIFYFLMPSPKIIYLKAAPRVPEEGDFYCLLRLFNPAVNVSLFLSLMIQVSIRSGHHGSWFGATHWRL